MLEYNYIKYISLTLIILLYIFLGRSKKPLLNIIFLVGIYFILLGIKPVEVFKEYRVSELYKPTILRMNSDIVITSGMDIVFPLNINKTSVSYDINSLGIVKIEYPICDVKILYGLKTIVKDIECKGIMVNLHLPKRI